MMEKRVSKLKTTGNMIREEGGGERSRAEIPYAKCFMCFFAKHRFINLKQNWQISGSFDRMLQRSDGT